MTHWTRDPRTGAWEAWPDREPEGRDFYMYDGDEFAYSDDRRPDEPGYLIPNWMWWTFTALALALWLGFAVYAGMPRSVFALGALLLLGLRWRDSVLPR